MTPPLDTPRLRLRAPVAADAPALDALFADPAASPRRGGPLSVGGAQGWIEEQVARLALGLPALLVLERRGAGPAPIGLAGLLPRSDPAEATLSVLVAAPHRGAGLGAEAAGAVLVAAFASGRLARVLGMAPPDDIPAIRLMERVGLRYRAFGLGPGGRAEQLYALDRP